MPDLLDIPSGASLRTRIRAAADRLSETLREAEPAAGVPSPMKAPASPAAARKPCSCATCGGGTPTSAVVVSSTRQAA